jgi:hypothetical protein
MRELVAVDQPIGLRVTANDGGRKKRLGHSYGLCV